MSEPTIDDRQQVVADLQAARGELVTRGWCKGDLQNDDGSVCAAGAVRVAINGKTELRYSDFGLARMIAAQMALSRVANCNLVDFNDAVGTEYQDVLDLFDKALAELGGLA